MELMKNQILELKILKQKNISKFDLEVNLPIKQKNYLNHLKIPLLGIHNIKNCCASISIAIMMGISIKVN